MSTVFIRLGPPEPQTGGEPAFIGGQPRIERDAPWPACELCRARQSFFYQIDFPRGHPWAGKSLAVFACVRCAHQDFLIPLMLSGPLAQAEVPVDFVVRYQTNFRFLVFPAVDGVLRTEAEPGVAFRPITLQSNGGADTIGQIGGVPRWVLEDESPAPPFCFLMQIDEDFVFETTPDAPPATTLSLRGVPEASPESGYSLFLSNALYLFGAEVAGATYVYALTQID